LQIFPQYLALGPAIGLQLWSWDNLGLGFGQLGDTAHGAEAEAVEKGQQAVKALRSNKGATADALRLVGGPVS